jgi:hypothetical protein
MGTTIKWPRVKEFKKLQLYQTTTVYITYSVYAASLALLTYKGSAGLM